MLAADINIIPDKTFFVLVGIFLFTATVLHWGVFHPLMRLLERRRAVTEGENERAHQIERAADGHDAEIHHELEMLKSEGAAIREHLREDGYREAQRITEDAKQACEQRTAAGYRHREKLHRAISSDLAGHLPELVETSTELLTLTNEDK